MAEQIKIMVEKSYNVIDSEARKHNQDSRGCQREERGEGRLGE
jgi:hypothetical protein